MQVARDFISSKIINASILVIISADQTVSKLGKLIVRLRSDFFIKQ